MISAAESGVLKSDRFTRIKQSVSPYWQLLFAQSPEGCGSTYVADHGTEVEHITFIYIPESTVGHRGIAHGGFLATLLDEALCHCGFAVLPHHVGVTASLDISYKAPTPAREWIVIRATAPKPENASRKAWVTGRIYIVNQQSEQLPWVYNQPTIESKLLVIEPQWWEKLKPEGAAADEGEVNNGKLPAGDSAHA